jgi:molecular chaperone DnaK (HSP70)
MVVAGIDIGSTHGCVGVWQNGKVNIIANDQGFRTTPANVCFEGDEVIVGDTAVNKVHSHAANTIFHLKRVLGKNHEDVAASDFVSEWSFDVAKGADGAVVAKTSRNGADHEVTPVEFLSILLKNLKNLAEDFTGETVDSVVISLPAHGGENQKELISAAAAKAGVNVLSYLSEPLAAAIAYGLDENTKNSHAEYAVVVDIGGATHDVTLVSIDKGLFEIVGTHGNDSLGGEDFTKAVFEHCVKAFQRKTKLNVKDNAKASSRLRVACEAAKRTLSTQSQVNIEVDTLMEGEDFALKLSRPRFEELIVDYVKTSLKEVEKVLEDADVDKSDVDHVILIGGSSRIPLVQTSVKKFFDGKKTHMHMSPDEVVAHGATLEAAAISELANFDPAESEQNNVAVTPLTLSVALANGSVSEVIHRQTVLPTSATEVFTTSADNQDAIFIQVYEGERAMAKDNTLLAQLRVDGISPLPKGEAEIEVTLAVSSKGVLTVTANEAAAGKKTLEVKNDGARLTAADVAEIVQKAEDAAEEDDALLDALEAEEEDAEEAEQADVGAAPAAAASSEDLD